MSYPQTLPLTMAGLSQPLKLTQIQGNPRLSRRLADLGLTPGVEMKVVQNQNDCVILGVRDSRIVLGQGMAHKIMVELA